MDMALVKKVIRLKLRTFLKHLKAKIAPLNYTQTSCYIFLEEFESKTLS